MQVFDLSRHSPKEELCSLTDQVGRSSRSVLANITEAWRKRRYLAELVCKFNDAEGETAQTQTHIEIAVCCGYLSAQDAGPLDAAYPEIQAMLGSMAAHPEQWCIRKR